MRVSGLTCFATQTAKERSRHFHSTDALRLRSDFLGLCQLSRRDTAGHASKYYVRPVLCGLGVVRKTRFVPKLHFASYSIPYTNGSHITFIERPNKSASTCPSHATHARVQAGGLAGHRCAACLSMKRCTNGLTRCGASSMGQWPTPAAAAHSQSHTFELHNCCHAALRSPWQPQSPLEPPVWYKESLTSSTA